MPYRFAADYLMRPTLGNLTFSLMEAAELSRPAYPHLAVRLAKLAREVEAAAVYARKSPRLGSIPMSDLNIVDIVSRVEAALTAKDNENAALQSQVNKLQAQIDATTADTLSDPERAALVDLSNKFPAAATPPADTTGGTAGADTTGGTAAPDQANPPA